MLTHRVTKMDKSPPTPIYNVPRRNHEEVKKQKKILIIQIMTYEIDAVFKTLPTKRNPGSDSFMGEFY